MIIKDEYLARKTCGFSNARRGTPTKHGKKSKLTHTQKNYRDWWMVKHTRSEVGKIGAGNTRFQVFIPKELIGKRVRFKLEVLE